MSTTISSSSPASVNNEQQTFSGQKRRPIDPPEDDCASSSSTTLYDSELMHQPKRPRTIDELGLSFSRYSLSAPDPPGNYSAGSKRKSGDYCVDDIEPKAKIPRSEVVAADISSSDRQQEQQQNQPIDPPAEKRKDISPTNVTSEIYGSTQQQDANSTNPNEGHEYRRNSSEMSIDDNNNSDNESCDGSSVSESSIRDAMYQLVFGRRQAMPSIGNGSAASGANYDTVDSKIEDLIRRSRMEATIKVSQKSQKREANNMDNDEGDNMKMDEDDDMKGYTREYDDEDDWHPGTA